MTPASIEANLAGVALFTLPGLGLAELFAPLRRMPWWRRLAWAFLLGVVAVGSILLVASHVFGVPLARPAIATAVLVPAALGLVARLRQVMRRRTAAPLPRRTRRPSWRLAAGAVVAALFLGTLASALSVPLADWDGRMIWSPLGEWMRHEQTADPSVLAESHWFVMHPRYPPLLSLAQAAVQESFGAGPDEQDYRAIYVAFFAALLLVLHDGARRAAGAAAAALATLCAALPHFVSYGAGGATSAYSDLPLAAFYGAALVLLVLAPPTPARGLLAGCLLAGAVFTKNEGELLAAAALAFAALRLLRLRRAAARLSRPLARRNLAWLAAAALPVLAAAALLASWRAAIPNRFDEDYFAALHLPTLAANAVARLPVILHEAARLSFRWSDWQGFWVLFLAVFLAGAPALRRPVLRDLLLAGLVPLAIAWAAYAETYPPANLAPFISETWPRFLIQGLVPLAIVFAATLAQALRQLRPGGQRNVAISPGMPGSTRGRSSFLDADGREP